MLPGPNPSMENREDDDDSLSPPVPLLSPPPPPPPPPLLLPLRPSGTGRGVAKLAGVSTCTRVHPETRPAREERKSEGEDASERRRGLEKTTSGSGPALLQRRPVARSAAQQAAQG
jgi:hypothetical protein